MASLHDSAPEGAPGAVLELIGVRPRFEDGGLTARRYDLRIMPGDCVLVEAEDAGRAALFADLCCGIVRPSEGCVKFMGFDWTALGPMQAQSLRGRVGRISANMPWIDFYGTFWNIMLGQMHHTNRPASQIEVEALALCRKFGLPGLPVLPPGRLTERDRLRASCVRAFMGAPALMLLEDPVGAEPADLMRAYLGEITSVRERGGAVIWFSSAPERFTAYRASAGQRFRLLEEGLFSMHSKGHSKAHPREHARRGDQA